MICCLFASAHLSHEMQELYFPSPWHLCMCSKCLCFPFCFRPRVISSPFLKSPRRICLCFSPKPILRVGNLQHFSQVFTAGKEPGRLPQLRFSSFSFLCPFSIVPCLTPFLSSPTAVDLLDKMLQLDVEKRLTATEALAHPYFDQFRDVEEETEAQQSYDDSLEHEKLSIDEWRSKKFYLL